MTSYHWVRCADCNCEVLVPQIKFSFESKQKIIEPKHYCSECDPDYWEDVLNA